jgi:hypothetical protein
MVPYPFTQNIIDIPDSPGYYNVNCCDTDVSLSVRPPIPRCASYSLPPLRVCCSSYLLCHDSSQEFLPTSGRTALETNGTPTAPIFLMDIQVAGHKAHEQPSTPQANHFATDITGQPHVKPHELNVGLAGDHDMEWLRELSRVMARAKYLRLHISPLII